MVVTSPKGVAMMTAGFLLALIAWPFVRGFAGNRQIR